MTQAPVNIVISCVLLQRLTSSLALVTTDYSVD